LRGEDIDFCLERSLVGSSLTQIDCGWLTSSITSWTFFLSSSLNWMLSSLRRVTNVWFRSIALRAVSSRCVFVKAARRTSSSDRVELARTHS
jgi:hypothetical protein